MTHEEALEQLLYQLGWLYTDTGMPMKSQSVMLARTVERIYRDLYDDKMADEHKEKLPAWMKGFFDRVRYQVGVELTEEETIGIVENLNNRYPDGTWGLVRAIKWLRSQRDIGLREAKHAVDQIAERYEIPRYVREG